ncbi:hypothetical protein Dimus_003976, partial [Dionaea muscipula]
VGDFDLGWTWLGFSVANVLVIGGVLVDVAADWSIDGSGVEKMMGAGKGYNSALTHPKQRRQPIADLNVRGWRLQIHFPRPGCVVDGLKMARSGSLDLVGIDGLKMGVGRHPWSARVKQ